MATTINQASAIRQSYQLVTVFSLPVRIRCHGATAPVLRRARAVPPPCWGLVFSRSQRARKGRHLSPASCQTNSVSEGAEGATPAPLATGPATDRTSGERPRASRIVRVARLDLPDVINANESTFALTALSLFLGLEHIADMDGVAERDRTHCDAALASTNFAAHALASS